MIPEFFNARFYYEFINKCDKDEIKKFDTLKREFRAWQHIHKVNENVNCFNCDMDGYIEHGKLPDYTKYYSKAEAMECFEDYMMYPEIHSMYDCTGRKFTNGYVLQRNADGYWTYYHRVGIDI